MMRYGVDVIEQAAAEGGGAGAADECQELVLHFFGSSQGALLVAYQAGECCAICHSCSAVNVWCKLRNCYVNMAVLLQAL